MKKNLFAIIVIISAYYVDTDISNNISVSLNSIEAMANCEVSASSSENNGKCTLSLSDNKYYCTRSSFNNDCISNN